MIMNMILVLLEMSDAFWVAVMGAIVTLITTMGTIIIAKINTINKQVNGHLSSLTNLIGNSVPKETVEKLVTEQRRKDIVQETKDAVQIENTRQDKKK